MTDGVSQDEVTRLHSNAALCGERVAEKEEVVRPSNQQGRTSSMIIDRWMESVEQEEARKGSGVEDEEKELAGRNRMATLLVCCLRGEVDYVSGRPSGWSWAWKRCGQGGLGDRA